MLHTKFLVLTLSLACLSLAWFCDSVDAQIQGRGGQRGNRQGGNRQGGNRPGGPGSPGSGALDRAGLEVGKKLPDVKIFDDQGKEFSTSSLKGSYTVLTFGCLT